MEHAQRIDLVLARLKNALAESEALKKDILERKAAKELPDSDTEGSGESEAGGSDADASDAGGSDNSSVDEPEEKPVKNTWCCCFRKQKLN
jgi:hypothetical protein